VVPARLGAAVARCLATAPRDRWPSAEAMLRAIDPGSALAERPGGTMVEEAGGRAAPSALTVDGAPGRARRTTGRSRVLVSAQAPTATLDGAPPAGLASSPGRPRPVSRPSRPIVVLAPPPPSRLPWVLAAVALVVALAASAALLSRARHGEARPPVAVARPVMVANAADGRFLARVDGKLALAFEVEEKQALTATLVSAHEERALAPIAGGPRQCFEAPAELMLDHFTVRLGWADGTPMSGGEVEHRGLIALANDWHVRLKFGADGEPPGKEGVRWAALLDALAAAVGAEVPRGAFARIAASKGAMDGAAAGTHARALARRAKAPLEPLFAAAGALLALPDAKLPLSGRRGVYESLLPARVLDRLLVSVGQTDVRLGAEEALGARFHTGPPLPGPELKSAGATKLSRQLLPGGGLAMGGENYDLLGTSGKTAMKGPPVESLPAPVLLAGAAGDPAVPAWLVLECHKNDGDSDTVGRDDLIWVTFPDRGWRLLLHADCLTSVGHAGSKFGHALDRALLAATTPLSIAREVLPRVHATHDRRVEWLGIVEVAIWR